MIFDFFKKREYSNVVQFPEKVPYPYIEPPEKIAPEAIYSIGATSEGTHMTLRMGYTTLTMTKQGCQDLIDQLEVFKNKLTDEE